MSKEARSIIRRPLVTEKGVRMKTEHNQYLFEVANDANKYQIAAAVEEIFEVTVMNVRTRRTHGKMKRLGRFRGKRPDRKRAWVTLAEGQTIQFFEEA